VGSECDNLLTKVAPFRGGADSMLARRARQFGESLSLLRTQRGGAIGQLATTTEGRSLSRRPCKRGWIRS